MTPGCQPDSHGVRALLQLFSSCPTGLKSCTAYSRGRCGSLDFPAKFVSFIRRALTLSAAWLDLLFYPIRAEFTNFSLTKSKPHSTGEGSHENTAFHIYRFEGHDVQHEGRRLFSRAQTRTEFTRVPCMQY